MRARLDEILPGGAVAINGCDSARATATVAAQCLQKEWVVVRSSSVERPRHFLVAALRRLVVRRYPRPPGAAA